jgi:hypothetical protein
MKFNRSIVFPLLALLVIVIIGFVLIRANRDSEETATEQINSTVSREELGQSGEVLGENTQPRDAQEVLPDPEQVSGGKELPVQSPVPSSPVPSTAQAVPTHQTVRYASLGFELVTPVGWKHRLEQVTNGLVVTFHDGKNVYGTVEGVNGYTSLEQFEAELRSNSAYSNVGRSEFNGMPALIYYSATRPGMNTAVMVKNRLYVFNGIELSKYLGKINFF